MTPSTISHEYKAQLRADNAAETTTSATKTTQQANVAVFNLESDPTSYNEALNQKDRKKWQEAIDKELNSLTNLETWTEEELPHGTPTVKSRWVFKKKTDRNGHVSKYKARGVAKGYTERAGIDFFNTYAPTMKLASLRILFAVAVHLKWDLRLLDVDSAFLMYLLPPTEVIYMDYLPGMR